MNCTYQLPRKHSVLPQPCPLCGRTDGTYQYVIFNHKNIMSRKAVICRIGHYDRNYYLSRQLQLLFGSREKNSTEPVMHLSRQLDTVLPSSTTPKIKKPSGKIWHSFKVRSSFFRITRDGRTVNLTEYFDAFKEDEGWKTSYTIKPEPWMSDIIKKYGWQMKESLWIARRKVKEYSFLLTKEDLLPKEIKEWFARRKKYHMSPP
jgi:hypothetical protein